MTMKDPFETEDLRPCRDCGGLFSDDALSDGQCFECWVVEAEGSFEELFGEELEEMFQDFLEWRLE